MKLAASKVDGFIKSFGPQEGKGKVILLYGRDQGAVHDTAMALKSLFLGSAPDAMQTIDLTESELAADAARLSDEANSISMFGGDKVIIICGDKDGTRKAVENYMSIGVSPETLVLIEAGNLTPASGIRKLIEKENAGLALPFYEPELRDIEALIRTALAEEELKIESSALSELANLLGADRGVARREVERLILFKGPKGSARPNGAMVTSDDIATAMHDQSHASLDGLIDAVALGDVDRADKTWGRLLLMGTRPEGAISAIRRHFQTLHVVLGNIETGVPRTEALSAFRPPLHFKRRPLVERQCGLWSRRKVETALEILHDTERECRQTGVRGETRTAYNLLRLARAARR
jgi:DNA polymerase III subunit delta